MNKPLNIAIAGLGTVGAGTLKVLRRNAGLIEARCGRKINVIAVSSRDKGKDRGVDVSGMKWVSSASDLVKMPEVDLVVETIGGVDGVARSLVESALNAGKHVVTANKALIAHHGLELAKIAEKSGAMLAYEAAVAGGVPIIKGLREGLAANRFHKVAGILNGTCNFILTSMWNKHQDFATVLAEAQRIGYAEADPAFDIDGIDTAHKLAIITSLAYGCLLNIDAVYVEGIRNISILDMEFADQLGYVIKLLGISTHTSEGVLQRVHPCMVAKMSTIGRVSDAYNAVIVEGDAVGQVTFEGKGAGEGATASSVVGDIIDIARGGIYKPFTIPVAALEKLPVATMDSLKASYYVRLAVVDKPGVLAAITSIFRDEGISMCSFLQNSRKPDETVQVVITTHETLELSMRNALKSIAALGSVIEPPHMIRIENL